jgi:hypothetical protein
MESNRLRGNWPCFVQGITGAERYARSGGPHVGARPARGEPQGERGSLGGRGNVIVGRGYGGALAEALQRG